MTTPRRPLSVAEPQDADLRVLDLLRRGELEVRRVCGAWTLKHVGGRGFERPRMAKGLRMFKRCGIPDPWDPNSPVVSLELGEVGIPDRRPVAPHAAPPKSASPASPQSFSPRIPMGAKPTPGGSGGERPEGTSPLIGRTRRDDTAELKQKMAEKEGEWSGRPRASSKPDNHRVDQPVRSLPMRPGTVVPGRPGQTVAPSGLAPTAGDRSSYGSPTAPPTGPPHMSIAPEPSRGAPVPMPPNRALPARAAPPTGKISAPAPRSGGFRMAGASRSFEPEELPLDAPLTRARATAVVDDDGPEELPLDAPSSIRDTPRVATPVVLPPAARPVKPGGLDDIFGMGAGESNTRIRIPKAEPRAEGEQKRRRPMVSDPATLGGLDRRPPPPKPPTITPSAVTRAGSSAAGADDLPDDGLPDE